MRPSSIRTYSAGTAGRPAGPARATRARQPGGVHCDDQRIVACADFMPPAPSGAWCCGRQQQFAQPLERDEGEDEIAGDHGGSSNRPAPVKPGPRAVTTERSAGRAAIGAVQDEQDRRRAHVAAVASTSRSWSSVPWQLERGLDRVDHFHAAGMAAEAVDVVATNAHVAQHPVDRPGESASMKGGIARSNTTARPRILDPPAHDAERVGPLRSPAPAIAAMPSPSVETTAAAAPSPNRAVATMAAGSSLSRRKEREQSSTETNSHGEPGSGPPAAPPARGRRPAGAAQAEHRHAPDIVAEAQAGPLRASRLGVAMPVVETVTTRQCPRLQSGAFDLPCCRLPKQGVAGVQIKPVVSCQPRLPPYRIDWCHGMTPGYSGIVEHARQAIERSLRPPNGSLALAMASAC